jgi:hypothetical protein
MPSSLRSKGKSGKQAGKAGSALDVEQQKLLEEQRRVQEEIDALQRTIDEAPRRPGDSRRPATQPYLTGSHGPRAHYRHAATIAGAEYMQSPSMASRPRKRTKRPVLRQEKTEGRIQTVALVIALLIAVGWLASRYM